MFTKLLEKLNLFLWRHFLPFFKQHGAESGDVIDYYDVYFRDNYRCRYLLTDFSAGDNPESAEVLLMDLQSDVPKTVSVSSLYAMQPEIVHFKRNHNQRYASVILFSLDHYSRLITLKKAIARIKGKVFNKREGVGSLSAERYAILKLLVSETLVARPSRLDPVGTINEINTLLYGRRWKDDVNNEEFEIKTTLILKSLVMTHELIKVQDRYIIQPLAITSVIQHEDEVIAAERHKKWQRMVFVLVLVITLAIVLIILVLLAMAGVVDLHNVWLKLVELKPIRFILKFL